MALFAAHALAVQTLFVALSYGAHAAPAADLHVFCLPSGEAPDTPASDKAHLDCCVLGSHVLGKLLVPPHAEPVAARKTETITAAAIVVAVLSLPRFHTPLTARGPPLA